MKPAGARMFFRKVFGAYRFWSEESSRGWLTDVSPLHRRFSRHPTPFPTNQAASRKLHTTMIGHCPISVNQMGAVVSEEHLTCAAMHRTVRQVIFNGSQSK